MGEDEDVSPQHWRTLSEMCPIHGEALLFRLDPLQRGWRGVKPLQDRGDHTLRLTATLQCRQCARPLALSGQVPLRWFDPERHEWQNVRPSAVSLAIGAVCEALERQLLRRFERFTHQAPPWETYDRLTAARNHEAVME